MGYQIGVLPCTPFASSRRSPQGETRSMERKNRESYISCTISQFPPLVANAESQSPECVSCHMTQKGKSRNVLASPLGEEGHEVAKGWTRVRMIMILDVDVTAERRHYNTHCPLMGSLCTPKGETTHYILCVALLLQNVFAVHRFAQGAADWRSGPRWSATSMLCPVHPFPLCGTSPQGETRSMERKTGRHILHVPFQCVPLWWLAPPPFPRKRGHYGCLAMEPCLYRKA